MKLGMVVGSCINPLASYYFSWHLQFSFIQGHLKSESPEPNYSGDFVRLFSSCNPKRYLESCVYLLFMNVVSSCNVRETSSPSAPLFSTRFASLSSDLFCSLILYFIFFLFKRDGFGCSSIRERPDAFLLTGHMVIFFFCQTHFLVINIYIFSLHVRDCKQLDDRSMSLASGRYMETIGWLSQFF
ncbi:uncharacterized protein VP01_25g3 [Puccinia sorghi]|uniref:Uncharacterized protein n=1 Tax=Puccinia sorghi TaxID=27349 RepID=A0A0L6V4M7_9BASI|nr:uncharacterized protein VP01_25g3 [Puccinia sorghi]